MSTSPYHRSRSESPSPNRAAEPSVRGYQLIGDSQFLRFSEQLLKKPRKQMNGLAYLGLCVSGQKVGDLLKRVRDNFAGRLSDRAVLMIGTNDLLQGTSYENMRANLDALLEQLRHKGVQKIIMLTIPPVPRLEKDASHWTRLTKFNEHILRRHNGRTLIVVNAYARFVEPRKSSLTTRTPSADKPSSQTSGRSSTPSSLRQKRSPASRSGSQSIFASIQNGKGGAVDADSSSDSDGEPPSSVISNLKFDHIRVSIAGDDEPGRQVYVLTSDGRQHRRFRDSSSSPPRQRSLRSSSSSPVRKTNRYARGDDASISSQFERRKRAHSPAPADSDDDDEYSAAAAKRRAYSVSTVDVRGMRSSTPAKKRAYSLSTSANRSDDDDNYSTPFAQSKKRRLMSHSSSVAEDDHNDRYASTNLTSQEQRVVDSADIILMDFFEKFFAGHRKRPDRIHFNNAGLRVIQRLILDAIDRDD